MPLEPITNGVGRNCRIAAFNASAISNPRAASTEARAAFSLSEIASAPTSATTPEKDSLRDPTLVVPIQIAAVLNSV
jgi:hypothetical protein